MHRTRIIAALFALYAIGGICSVIYFAHRTAVFPKYQAAIATPPATKADPANSSPQFLGLER